MCFFYQVINIRNLILHYYQISNSKVIEHAVDMFSCNFSVCTG